MKDCQFSLSFILDRDGYNSINLISFSSLHELDVFIKKHFKGREDVLEKYNDEIGEFCLDNISFIKRENKKNKRKWMGSIVIICDFFNKNDEITSFHKIPVIYQDDNNLLNRKDCLKKIKEKLQSDDILHKLFKNKYFLLTENEQELLGIYFKFGYKKCKDDAIAFLMQRLYHMDINETYYYCRTLANLCKLYSNYIETKFGNFYDINYELLKEDYLLNKKNKYSKVVYDENDVYLNKLINEDNYENLFNMYDIDEINKKSNYIKNLEERGKKNV